LDTEQERQAKEQAQTQVVMAAQAMVARGMALDDVVALLGLSDELVKQVMAEVDDDRDRGERADPS